MVCYFNVAKQILSLENDGVYSLEAAVTEIDSGLKCLHSKYNMYTRTAIGTTR